MALNNGQPPLRCADYHVAWICAVADLELLPARLMLDEEHPTPPYDTHYDENTYICGRINGHAVVVATCPQGETGNVNAGRLTGSLFKTFPNIRMTVLVGIGGGIPRAITLDDALDDIHLGDVVVGWPGDGKPACVYHDRGRAKTGGEFEMVGTMQNPDWRLTSALGVLASDHELGRTTFDEQLARLRQHKAKKKFAHPGLEHDRLFKAAYSHVGDNKSSCAACDKSEVVQRPERSENSKDELVFHQGRIATGNAVIQDARLRDQISARCGGVLCVEMEAAGVDVNRQCLVIRGISDYADSHKNNLWRSYAAGRAAAFARALLFKMQPAAAWEMQAVLRPQMPGLPHGPDKKFKSNPSQEMSIKMFQKLVSKEGVLQGDSAGRFVSKLASILKSISMQDIHVSSVKLDGKTKILAGFEDLNPRDMKRLRNIVKSAHSVCVNANAAKFEAGTSRKFTQKRSMQVVNIQGHEVSVMLLERSSSQIQYSQSRGAVREKKVETIAKIRITETSGEQAVLTAYILYRQGLDGQHTLNPIISIGKTLPQDSPVFTIVENGDIDSLRHLLAQRLCTLRDRDTNGVPLLHYAMENPNMCRFLLENGADIDELAADLDDRRHQVPPLGVFAFETDMLDENLLQRARECRRLLLDAGADPTLAGDEAMNLEQMVTMYGTPDSVKDVLEGGKYFINLNGRDSPLFTQAVNWGSGYCAEVFAVLLDKGADIHVRNKSGRTCLQVAVASAFFPDLIERRIGSVKRDVRSMKREVCALLLLIGRGANISTSSDNGRSIFDDAYECDHDGRQYLDDFRTPPLGSYRGDLWDHVLIRSGHAERSRPPEERIYHYTWDYTEDHFKLLWKGWEHLCPYSDESSSACSVVVLDTDDEEESEESEEEESEEDKEENENVDNVL